MFMLWLGEKKNYFGSLPVYATGLNPDGGFLKIFLICWFEVIE